MRRLHMARFHGENDLLGLAVPLVFVVEVEAAVNPLVRALLLFERTRPDKAQRSPLKLIGIVLGKPLSAR